MSRAAYRRFLRRALRRNSIRLLASLGAFPDATAYREPLWAKQAMLRRALKESR